MLLKLSASPFYSQISGINDTDETRFAEYHIGRHLVGFGSVNRKMAERQSAQMSKITNDG